MTAEDRGIWNKILESLRKTDQLGFDWTPHEEGYVRSEPESKWVDYLIYRYKFKIYPQKKIVSDFPVYLLIEPTSICNLRCTVCFQVDASFTVKPYMGLMDLDFYKRVIDEAEAGGTKAITLASRGEPTLHPKLSEILAYTAGKFIDLKLNTNATRLPESLCNEIIDSGVNELVFSIDSHDKKIYEEIRVRGKFEEVLANVQRFRSVLDKRPGAKTNTRVAGVRFRSDQNAQEFAQFWSQYVDQVGYINVEQRWDTYNNRLNPQHSSPCTYLWERMYVWFDGKTNPCDVDYKSLLSPGNMKDRSLRDTWHGESYTKLRQAHLSGNRSQYNPCDRCGV